MAQARISKALDEKKEEHARAIKIKTECLRLTLKNLQNMLEEEKRKLKEEKIHVKGLAKEKGLVLLDTNAFEIECSGSNSNPSTIVCHDYPIENEVKPQEMCHPNPNDYYISSTSNNALRSALKENKNTIDEYKYIRPERLVSSKSDATNRFDESKFVSQTTSQTDENKYSTVGNGRYYNVNHTSNDNSSKIIHLESDNSQLSLNREDSYENYFHETFDDPTNDKFIIEDYNKYEDVISSSEEYIRNKLEMIGEDKTLKARNIAKFINGDNTVDRGGVQNVKRTENTEDETAQNEYHLPSSYLNEEAQNFNSRADSRQNIMYGDNTWDAEYQYNNGDANNEEYLNNYYNSFQDNIKTNGTFEFALRGDNRTADANMKKLVQKYDPPYLDWRQGDAGMNIPQSETDLDDDETIKWESRPESYQKYTADWLLKETTNITAETTYTVGFVNEIINQSGQFFNKEQPYISQTNYYQHFESDPMSSFSQYPNYSENQNYGNV